MKQASPDSDMPLLMCRTSCIGSIYDNGSLVCIGLGLPCKCGFLPLRLPIQLHGSHNLTRQAALLVQRSWNFIKQRCVFSIAGPVIWNALPVALCRMLKA